MGRFTADVLALSLFETGHPAQHFLMLSVCRNVSPVICNEPTFDHTCSHRIDSLAGSLGGDFVLDRPDGDIKSYAVGDQCLLIDHHGHPFHQLLQLAVAVECCILHQDGCLSCAIELARRLDIKIVVC